MVIDGYIYPSAGRGEARRREADNSTAAPYSRSQFPGHVPCRKIYTARNPFRNGSHSGRKGNI